MQGKIPIVEPGIETGELMISILCNFGEKKKKSLFKICEIRDELLLCHHRVLFVLSCSAFLFRYLNVFADVDSTLRADKRTSAVLCSKAPSFAVL